MQQLINDWGDLTSTMTTLLKQTLSALFLLALLPAMNALADDGKECATLFQSEEYQAATPICKRAAEQGDAEAQLILNSMPTEGEDAQWLDLVFQKVLARTQFLVGFVYNNGIIVPQDNNKAVRWYRLAGEQGDAYAQAILGFMYDNGEGVAQDKREAAKWYHLAAEQGVADAQSYLGFMYYFGDGVAKNYYESYVWFLLAASQGNTYAQESLNLVKKKLTPEQLSTAKEEAARRAVTYQ